MDMMLSQCTVSGSGETDKSHLVKAIYNAISKTLLYHCKDPEKPRVLFLGPTGISAVNKGGTTIHSGLVIKPEQSYLVGMTNLKLLYEIGHQR